MQEFEDFREIEGIRNTSYKINIIFTYLSPIVWGSLFHLKLIQRFSKQFQITQKARIWRFLWNRRYSEHIR